MLLKAIIVAILAAVFLPPIRFFWNAGFGLHFHKQHPGKCTVVKKPGIGSEDFQILTTGQTFVTSGLTLPIAAPKCNDYVRSKGKGAIVLVDMNNPGKGGEALAIKHDKSINLDTFRPHGLSVLEDKVKGEHLIYVVNHPEGGDDGVEKFRFLPKTKELRHVKSMTSDLLRLTNDLSVVSEDKFYISNWLYFKTHLTGMLEHLYPVPLSSLLYYNGTGFTVVKDRLYGANGVLLSKDKRYLYLALPIQRIMHVYKVNSEYDLQLVQEVSTHTAVDNLHLSEDGNSLFGGCHPIAAAMLKHSTDPANEKAPAQVIQLPLKNGLINAEEITQEFYDVGKLIAGSSIGGVYKDKLLIGSVIDTLVSCQLPAKP